MLKKLKQVYKTGLTEKFEELPLTFDGETYYFEVSYVARRDELDEIDGVISLGINITSKVAARKKLEQNEASYIKSEEQLNNAIQVAM